MLQRSRSNRVLSHLQKIVVGLVLLLPLGSCSTQPASVSLSSGVARGFYNRLGEQIRESGQLTLGLRVQNQASQGSRENLQRLLNRQVDFALVQLDVASEAMREGKIQAVVILATEHIHVITHRDSGIRSFAELENRRVAIGAIGSGIRHTANQLLQASGFQVQANDSGFDAALNQLKARQIDAVLYVGSIGASEKLRQQFTVNPDLQLVPIQSSLINYLTIRDPGSYQPATIPAGAYQVRPANPVQDLATLSTATAVVTRPDISPQKVELLTWAILANSRKYSPFYPELQRGDARSLLQRGLFYIHPAAQKVFEQGDPRNAWMRYWQENSDLQAGIFILLSTSGVGLLLRHWQREHSKQLVSTTMQRLNELKDRMPEDTYKALERAEELSLEQRLMFLDGAVTAEVYNEVQQKTQMFVDQCQTLIDQERKKVILDTLLLLDDWQETLQTNPAEALQKLSQIKQQYREMLLADQVDIEAYIELVELTLLSLMTLTSRQMGDGERCKMQNAGRRMREWEMGDGRRENLPLPALPFPFS